MGIEAAILGSAAIGAGSSIFGALTGRSSANAALEQQLSMFNQVKKTISPFVNAGRGALPILTKLLTPGASMTDTLSQIPGFQFLQDWGQRGITNQATSRGLGGNVLKAGADYATGAAQSQGFFPLIQSLLGFAGLGSNAASSLGGTAAQFSGQAGNSIMTGGQAMASGMQGAGNALSGGLNQYAQFSMLDKLTNGALSGGMYGAPA